MSVRDLPEERQAGTATGHGRPTPALALREVSFAYAQAQGEGPKVLDGATMEVPEGSFVLLTGETGSGKSTCLRLAKREVRPVGHCEGTVEVFGRRVETLSVDESCQLVGYVFQSPDNQIVCDTVWHELAFGLENMRLGQQEMRRRLFEVCVFLGIEQWFRRRCDELSEGQRQIVSLAAVLAMRPRLLLLDEPTSMLDPVAEKELLSLLYRANRELGVTVVVATHDPAAMVDYATGAFALERGRLRAVPLSDVSDTVDLGEAPAVVPGGSRITLLDDVWLRYERTGPWVLRGCDLSLCEGEVRALVGGNGSGKSTVLSVAAGVLRPRRGRANQPLRGQQALLPQQPKALLGCESVGEELLEWSRLGGYGAAEVEESLAWLGLEASRDSHPYDLSGGQQQLLVLEKLLLMRPRLLLLDEPTKGLDATCRRKVAQRVAQLSAQGCAVVVATHDRAFVRAVAHTVSLLFDGQTGEPEATRDFFVNSWMWHA